MIDSTNDLNFSDYGRGKVVGTHTETDYGNGLKNKDAKEIIIPEKYLGSKVIEIGVGSFYGTNIESVFVSRYIKSILDRAFHNCTCLKNITFDSNSELESLGSSIIASGSLIESINLPLSLREKIGSSRSSFYGLPNLKCVSYFGKNNLSSSSFFDRTGFSSDFVIYTLPSYNYTFKNYEPVRTGQRCEEKAFEIQFMKRRRRLSCQCAKNPNGVNTKIVMILLLVS